MGSWIIFISRTNLLIFLFIPKLYVGLSNKIKKNSDGRPCSVSTFWLRCRWPPTCRPTKTTRLRWPRDKINICLDPLKASLVGFSQNSIWKISIFIFCWKRHFYIAKYRNLFVPKFYHSMLGINFCFGKKTIEFPKIPHSKLKNSFI